MEIEKKFLTKQVPFDLSQFTVKHIHQCYISTIPTIRIRKSNDTYTLTIKSQGDLAKQEFELPLTQEEYQHLLLKAETPMIEKKRYLVVLEQGFTAEVDVYEGHLSGLITTEVEFDTLGQAQSFIPPKWFGKEVTTDHRYKNTSLSQHGIPEENE